MMKSRNYSIKYRGLIIVFLLLSLIIFLGNPIELHKSVVSKNIILLGKTSTETVRATAKINNVNQERILNDPFFDTEWHIDNQGQYMNLSQTMKQEVSSTEDVDMDVIDAWNAMSEAGISDHEVVVAVIDTGVDYNHPDLADNMWVNKGEIPGDNIDNDNNGFIDDIYGWDFYNNDNTVCHYKYSERYNKNVALPEDNDNHGTHVAGIIAAVANNNTGIAGVASNIKIKIMSLKINGGSKAEGDIQDAIEAIKYATKMGADICNISWCIQADSEELKEVMRESDMLFVAAAGNTGDDDDIKPLYPVGFNLDNVISVTFIDADGRLTADSNYGAKSVDLAAPGDDIFSTIVGSYASMSGSSMAAPQVTAVAGMLYAYNDHLYAADVKEILTNNIKELSGLDKSMVYGGIPSAYKAIMAADQLSQDTTAPEMTLETIYNQNKMIIPVHVTDTGASGVRVIKWIYGEKKAKDFERGMNGTTVVDGQADLWKAGIYTFYAADYAGNETTQVYKVIGDTSPPKVTTAFTVAANYKSRTITVKAIDTQSGMKRVEYMPGIKKEEDFLPANSGIDVALKNGKGKFKIKKDGIYTLFAMDNRGNITIKQIKVKTVKASDVNIIFHKQILSVGKQLDLKVTMKPADSTDKIIYTSSNEKVVRVSTTGKVTALAEGKAYITATTTGGLTSTCLILVKPKTG